MNSKRRTALIIGPFVLVGMILAVAAALDRPAPPRGDFATPITPLLLTEDDFAFWTSTLEVLGQAVEQSRLLPKARSIESLTAEIRSTKALRMTLLDIGEPKGIDMGRFFLVHQEIGRSLQLGKILQEGVEETSTRGLVEAYTHTLAAMDEEEANGISAPPGTRQRIEEAIPRLEHAAANPFHKTLRPGGRESLNVDFVNSRADALRSSWEAFEARVEAATVVPEKPPKPGEAAAVEKRGGSE